MRPSPPHPAPLFRRVACGQNDPALAASLAGGRLTGPAIRVGHGESNGSNLEDPRGPRNRPMRRKSFYDKMLRIPCRGSGKNFEQILPDQ